MNEEEKSVVVAQAPPKKNETTPIWDLVIKDIQERDANGLKKYGTRLQAFNGRNALIDSYQEVLDLIVYFRQSVEERDVMVDFLKKVSKLTEGSDGQTINDLSFEAYTLLRNLGEIR